MAKDPKNLNNDEDAEAPAIDPATAKAKRKKIMIMALLLVGLIGISVGSTLFLVKLFSEPDAEAVPAEDMANLEPPPPPKQPAVYYPMQPVFVVNFESQGRQRFLQAELNLMLRDKDVVPALELHMPAIRNSLVMLFSGQIYEDLQTAEGKELLRQQALLSVQEVLQQEIGKPGVEQVLFTNFVMQ